MKNTLQGTKQIMQGFMPDAFLAGDPDCPVFGLNLACAYPFPVEIEPRYSALAGRLARLDGAVYVYPFWKTHVTIVTFVSFCPHPRPSPGRVAELRSLIAPLTEMAKSVLAQEKIPQFRLEFQAPVLSGKAAILPIINPTCEILRIRRHILQMLDDNKKLRDQLIGEGLNVPGIIHSTIMRFKSVPADAARFTAGFDEIAAEFEPFAITISEILLTAETRPYMRSGEKLHRFLLEGAPRAV